MQGHRSHLVQAKKCHLRWQADLDTRAVRIFPRAQSLFEGRSNDDNQTAGIGEHLATDPSVDWNVHKPKFPELPADEPLVLEEHRGGHDEDNSDNTPSSTPCGPSLAIVPVLPHISWHT